MIVRGVYVHIHARARMKTSNSFGFSGFDHLVCLSSNLLWPGSISHGCLDPSRRTKDGDWGFQPLCDLPDSSVVDWKVQRHAICCADLTYRLLFLINFGTTDPSLSN